MALDQKFFKKSTAATGLADQEQGLTAHLDANDIDSYDGDGSIWYDIAGHEVNIPLVDKASNLQLHLNANDTTSYSGSGNDWADISQNSNTATDTNPTYSSDTRGYFVMDGSNDYFTINYDASLYMTSNTGFTIEVWVNRDNNNEGYIIASDDGSTYPYALQWHNNHGYYGWISGSSFGGTVGLGDTSSNGVGEWDHVIITQSSVDRKNRLYVNGTLIGTSAAVSGFHSTSSGVNIGAYHNEAVKFDGKIGVIRIYNVALTASEVGQNFRAGNFLSYSSIITSKHEATQSSLVTAPPTQGTLHTSNLQINLDANSYSGSGNWLDSANDYDATISAATYVNDNNSDYFDFAGSTNNPVYISYNSILNAAARTWEWWVWFDTDAMNFFGGVWGSANNTKTVLFRMKDSNNAVRAQVYDGAGTSVEPTTANNVVNTNEWNHIVFTSDNSDNSFKIYVNGVEKYSDTLSIDMNTSSTDNFIIGAGGGYSSNRLDGRVAQFRYYNAVLTSAQVTTNYNATKDLYQGITSLELHLDANGYSSGNWSDTSGNNRHATISGNTAHTNDNNSDYFTLDGTGDYFTVAHNNIFNLEVDNTIEMWIWRSSTTNEQTLMHKGESWSSGNAWFLNWTSGAGYYFYDYDTGSLTKSGTAAAPLNEWTHLILSWNAGTRKAKMYINGVEPSYHTTPTDGGGSVGAANTDALEIGKEGVTGTGHPAWNGKIAQVRWYKGAMTASQAKTNYDATKELYQNPTLKLHFDASDIDTTANTWTDKVSSLVLTKSGTSSYDAELGDFLQLGGGYYGNDSAAVQVKDSVGDFTVEYFMQHVFDGSYAILGIMQNSSQRGLFLATTSSYILNYNYNLNATSSAGQEISTPTNHLTANKWHHVVFVYDSSANIKFYVDGVLKVTTSVASSSSWTTTDGIRIGDMETLSYGSNGKMGYLKMYQGKLSDAQIVQNYLATKSQFPNGHNATISGSPTWGTNSSPAYNYFGFDSNSEYLSIPDSSDFDLVSNQSLEIWVYNDHSGPQHYINKPGSPGGYAWQLYWQSSNHSFQMHNTGNSGITVSAGTNSANTWAHLVLTVGDSQDYKLYLNAGTPGTGTLSGTPSTSTVPVTIGRYYPTSTYGLQGRIGMIKFYGKTLSATEVTTAYNNTKGTYGIT